MRVEEGDRGCDDTEALPPLHQQSGGGQQRRIRPGARPDQAGDDGRAPQARGGCSVNARAAETPMAAQVRSSGWAAVCELTDLWPGIGVCVLVNGRQIAIFRIGDALYALDNFDPAS